MSEKHRGTLSEWLAKLAGHSANQLAVEIEEDDKLLVLGKPQPVVLAGNVNSGGTVTGNSATGTVPVTEASAASINLNVGYLSSITRLAALPVVGTPGVLADNNWYRRKKVVPIATDGAGAAAATELVGTVAGFYPVIDRVLVWCATADAATTLTFSSGGGGALVGVPAPIIVLVAATTCEMLDGLIWYNLTDATTLSVAIAGAPATNTVYFVVEYHYET